MHTLPDSVRRLAGSLETLQIQNAWGRVEVTLHGAHVTVYQPKGQKPVLFLSQSSHFTAGKAIRGGVPVIFPWFGGRPNHPEAPMHGFARTAVWELESVQDSPEATQVTLRLDSSELTRAQWPHEFILRHRITLGATLEMVLEVENLGSTPFSFEEALHTYFQVSDVREIELTGLAQTTYIDKVDALSRKVQDSAPMRFIGETDQVYVQTPSTCILNDAAWQRRILVEKEGSQSTVIWNPWIAKAKAMADFGDEEWPDMLCIETANAGPDSVTLQPGQTHRMRATIRTEAI